MDNLENNNEEQKNENQVRTSEEKLNDVSEKKVQYYSNGQFGDNINKNTAPAARKKMPTWAKALIIIAAVIVGIIILTTSCNNFINNVKDEFAYTSSNEVTTDFGYDYIGTVHVEGEISESISGEYNHEYILNSIDAMIADPENKGLILYVDTPGGSVFASDELYFKIKEYQEKTDRPVYSSMQSMAASGGYYISAPCDKIIANRNCWTGSIGVTMGTLIDVSGLLDNLGIKTETITSGANKSMGSSYEPMTDEQREIFQSLVDEAYEQFVGIVAEGRNMDKDEVIKLADGRIYTAMQAKEIGLVDQIGTYEDAIEDMKQTYGLQDCKIEEFYTIPSTDLLSLFGKSAQSSVTDADAIEGLLDLNGKFKLSYISEVQK